MEASRDPVPAARRGAAARPVGRQRAALRGAGQPVRSLDAAARPRRGGAARALAAVAGSLGAPGLFDDAEPLALVGGLGTAVYITAGILLFPRLGALVAVGLFIAGQMLDVAAARRVRLARRARARARRRRRSPAPRRSWPGPGSSSTRRPAPRRRGGGAVAAGWLALGARGRRRAPGPGRRSTPQLRRRARRADRGRGVLVRGRRPRRWLLALAGTLPPRPAARGRAAATACPGGAGSAASAARSTSRPSSC